MTSYPKQSKLFQAWAKAMVAGATVDKPNYSATSTTSRASRRKKRRKRVTNRRKKNAKKIS